MQYLSALFQDWTLLWILQLLPHPSVSPKAPSLSPTKDRLSQLHATRSGGQRWPLTPRSHWGFRRCVETSSLLGGSTTGRWMCVTAPCTELVRKSLRLEWGFECQCVYCFKKWVSKTNTHTHTRPKITTYVVNTANKCLKYWRTSCSLVYVP